MVIDMFIETLLALIWLSLVFTFMVVFAMYLYWELRQFWKVTRKKTLKPPSELQQDKWRKVLLKEIRRK